MAPFVSEKEWEDPTMPGNSGERKKSRTEEYNLGMVRFKSRVLEVVAAIPEGRVTTYGAIGVPCT